MSLAFGVLLVALFGLAGIGMPVGYAILTAATLYLGIGGRDLALAGETALQGLYGSFVLLAVPLFITAA
ncbi:MAG: TRAP transporter large permease, partial [Maritimibacter sp.]|nr:TRAP transporter large permease [Maritimibacter sp.]